MRDYANEGMEEMSKKFVDEGSELYKEEYKDEAQKVAAAGDDD